jgi:phytoene synthase
MDWMREAGLDPDAFLAQPAFSPALGTVVQRLLREAERLYERAAAGIARLPLACQPGIWAARYLYAEIGREIERQGFDSVSKRAVVSAQRKAGLMARALAAPAIPVRADTSPPLPEARFLIDSVTAHPGRDKLRFDPSAPVGERNFGEQVVWVVQLFSRLEELERADASGRRRRPAAALTPS